MRQLVGSSRSVFLLYYFTLPPPEKEEYIFDDGDDPYNSQAFCQYIAQLEETKLEGGEDDSEEGDFVSSAAQSTHYSLSEEIKEEKEEEKCSGAVDHFIGDKCPIYRRLKERDGKDEKEDNKEDVWHIQNYFHGRRERKPLCKNPRNCERVQRLHGRGYSPEDMRHSLIYRHKMIRQSSMLAKIGDLVRMTPMKYCKSKPPQVYVPNWNKMKPKKGREESKEKLAFSLILIEEVIRNGYIEDLLCGLGRPKVDMKDLKESDCKLFPIWRFVEEKLMHPKHEKMGYPLESDPSKVLAVILYTGGKCNEDLCKSQREGDYKKWEHFDLCLTLAIHHLSYYHMFDYPLYCGLKGVYFEEADIKWAVFNSYLSTSQSEEVAMSFRGKKGALIKIEGGVKSGFAAEGDTSINCCDVSWISKFPNEREILISRGQHFEWKAKVINETSEGQFVSLSLSSDWLVLRSRSAFSHLPFDYNLELVPNDKLIWAFNAYIKGYIKPKCPKFEVKSVEDICAHMKEDVRLSEVAFVEEAIENIKGRVAKSKKLVREKGKIDLKKFEVYECRKGVFRCLEGDVLRISPFGKWEKEVVFIHRKKQTKPVPPGW